MHNINWIARRLFLTYDRLWGKSGRLIEVGLNMIASRSTVYISGPTAAGQFCDTTPSIRFAFAPTSTDFPSSYINVISLTFYTLFGHLHCDTVPNQFSMGIRRHFVFTKVLAMRQPINQALLKGFGFSITCFRRWIESSRPRKVVWASLAPSHLVTRSRSIARARRTAILSGPPGVVISSICHTLQPELCHRRNRPIVPEILHVERLHRCRCVFCEFLCGRSPPSQHSHARCLRVK
jgi:hypothetical protein